LIGVLRASATLRDAVPVLDDPAADLRALYDEHRPVEA
jgi:hypothetical protein